MKSIQCIFLFLLVGHITISFAQKHGHYITDTFEIDGPSSTGTWDTDRYCPEKSFVSGITLKAQPDQGRVPQGSIWGGIFSFGISSIVQAAKHHYDDNGLVDFKILCTNKNGDLVESKYAHGLDTSVATGATWSNVQYCPGKIYATGVMVKQQASQGAGDDFGITNLRLLCADGTTLSESFSHEPGEWREHKCPKYSAICGVKTKTDFEHWDDTTGIDGIIVYCCKAPNDELIEPSKSCIAESSWKEVARFKNSGVDPTNYRYTYKTGISKSESYSKSSKNTQTSSWSTLFGIEKTVGAEISIPELIKVSSNLKLKFETVKGEISGTEKDTSNTHGQTWDQESTHELVAQVLPGFTTKITQLIGNCGPYSVQFTALERVDHCPSYLPEEECNGLKYSLHKKFIKQLLSR